MAPFFCAVFSQIMINTTSLRLVVWLTFVLLAHPFTAQSQAPSRLPLTTGVSGYQMVFHSDTTIWMADGSVVYRNIPSNTQHWQAMPQLYRCASAFIVRATPETVTVVAKRIMTSDSSWWVFTSNAGGTAWLDSLKLDARGSIRGSTPSYLLFSESPRDTTMALTVWRYDGTFATTVLMPNVHNNDWVSARLCGDSIIVSDPLRGALAYDVIRNVDQDPGTWTTDMLSDVVFGFVGEGNSFVFLTSGAAYIDHGGEVKPLGVFFDRIQDLYVDGLKAGRIGGGGLEITPDIRSDSSRRISLGVTLAPGIDKVFTLRRAYAGIERGTRGLLELATGVVDGSVQRDVLVPCIDGTVTRGTTSLLAGERVVVGEYLQLPTVREAVPSICDLTPSPNGISLEPRQQVASSSGQIFLRNVNGEVWAGTRDGTFTFPDYVKVSNRTAYDVVGGGDRVFMLTQRGIEIREGSDSTFRVFVDEQAPAGFAVAGDTLVVIRIEDITTDIPEARWVVDAYDRLGNVMFYGALIADSVVKSGLRWRSIVSTSYGLLINGQKQLFLSVNGGASWTSVNPGVELTTATSATAEQVCAWGILPNGFEGPSLMISPDRWVTQTTMLRTPQPVIACASMPGFFVFSTGEGLYSLKQTISSVWESPLQGASNIPIGAVPDETITVDLMGRICLSNENLPTGWYVVTQRFGNVIQSQIRLIVK